MSVTVTADFSKLQQWLEETSSQLQMFIRDFLEQSSELVAEEMRARAPARTGALRKSITRVIERESAFIGPTVPYALFVEVGTRPHMIYPRAARALRFEVGGRTVFAAHVFHPGFPGRFYAKATREAVVPRLIDLFVKMWRAAFGWY